MAKIIEGEASKRRIIRLSTNDIISVIKDYQRVVPRNCSFESVCDYLNDIVIYIPEDV